MTKPSRSFLPICHLMLRWVLHLQRPLPLRMMTRCRSSLSATSRATEGNSGTKDFTFNVTLSAASSLDTTVDFYTDD
jgi:hypothetical protein